MNDFWAYAIIYTEVAKSYWLTYLFIAIFIGAMVFMYIKRGK